MSVVAWFFLGLVSGQVVLLAVLALCSVASGADRRLRKWETPRTYSQGRRSERPW